MTTIREAEKKMKEAVEATRREFSSVRTGKASPSLLDTVKVEAYGSKVPIKQVATVSAPEASMLMVQPFDPNIIQEIEKAIMTADLGLNPSNDGTVLRIPIPRLNEERRQEYVRLLHKMAEDGRISIRQARREANDEIKEAMNDHEIGEDEGHRQLEKVQELTDEHIDAIDRALAKKEKEVTEV